MITLLRRSSFDRQPSLTKIRAVAPLSVMVASMLTVIPVVADAPLVPPFGLMMFLAWRLLQREIWHPWAGVALGLFDDLWSKQPPGTAMLLWSVAQTLIAIGDQRALWRDYWQDWAISSVLIAVIISAGLAVANFTGGHTPWLIILPQILISILVQPLVMRLCGFLDQWRFT